MDQQLTFSIGHGMFLIEIWIDVSCICLYLCACVCVCGGGRGEGVGVEFPSIFRWKATKNFCWRQQFPLGSFLLYLRTLQLTNRYNF